jgi:hypothetical protein
MLVAWLGEASKHPPLRADASESFLINVAKEILLCLVVLGSRALPCTKGASVSEDSRNTFANHSECKAQSTKASTKSHTNKTSQE